MSRIREFLEEMGYKISQQGDFYRCNALYRGGDNPTALSVNAETGIWCDFVKGHNNIPFETLIRLTTGKEDSDILESYKSDKDIFVKPRPNTKQDYMKNEYYDPKILENLLNLYTFYEERGISKKTQDHYLCGYAGSGQMYGRVIFPIYDETRNLIGFSGRDALNRPNAPKWKHTGKKKNFVYPFYLPEMQELFEQSFNKKREVIIVESIGDSMALFENGFYNNLVAFGLQGSSAILSFVNSLYPEIVTIAFNNDKNSEVNRGLVGAIKTWIAFSQFLGTEKVVIKLPLLNDFGDMAVQDRTLFDTWAQKEIDREKQLDYIKKFLVEKPSLFTKQEIAIAKKIL